MAKLLNLIPKIFKKKEEIQSKYVIRIIRNIIPNLKMDHINLKHLFIIRSDIQNFNEDLHIFRLPRELIIGLDLYYVISIQPTFDLLPEYLQYRKVYHTLKHIPKNYQINPELEPHDLESFDNEYKFDEKFRETLLI